MSVEKTPPRRSRSSKNSLWTPSADSVGSSKSHRLGAAMPRRLSNSFISKVECKTRSRSVDLSSLSRSFSSSKPPSLSLLLEFQSFDSRILFIVESGEASSFKATPSKSCKPSLIKPSYLFLSFMCVSNTPQSLVVWSTLPILTSCMIMQLFI